MSSVSNAATTHLPVIEKALRDYLIQISSTIASSNEVDEGLVENVLAEIKGKEFAVAIDKRSSIILEQLIRSANAEQVKSLIKACTSNIRVMFTHACGSRVMQTLFRAVEKYQDDVALQKAVGGICDEIQNGYLWADLVYDKNGSHVIRSLITLLSGVTESNDRDRFKQKTAPKPVPKKFDSRLTTTVALIIESLQHCQSLAVCALYPQACALLSLLLESLYKHPALQNALAAKYIQPLLRIQSETEEEQPPEGQEVIPAQYAKRLLGDSLLKNKVFLYFSFV